MKKIYKTITAYNSGQLGPAKDICKLLKIQIDKNLKKSESKIWHGSPVWFLNGNPVVNYSVRKNGLVSLMFFSGQSFDEKKLQPEGTFKAAEIFYAHRNDVKIMELKKWLQKAKNIQWDYKNIVKNKGKLYKVTEAKE